MRPIHETFIYKNLCPRHDLSSVQLLPHVVVRTFPGFSEGIIRVRSVEAGHVSDEQQQGEPLTPEEPRNHLGYGLVVPSVVAKVDLACQGPLRRECHLPDRDVRAIGDVALADVLGHPAEGRGDVEELPGRFGLYPYGVGYFPVFVEADDVRLGVPLALRASEDPVAVEAPRHPVHEAHQPVGLQRPHDPVLHLVLLFRDDFGCDHGFTSQSSRSSSSSSVERLKTFSNILIRALR